MGYCGVRPSRENPLSGILEGSFSGVAADFRLAALQGVKEAGETVPMSSSWSEYIVVDAA